MTVKYSTSARNEDRKKFQSDSEIHIKIQKDFKRFRREIQKFESDSKSC